MPVLANNRLEKQRIAATSFRFLNSYMPDLTSISGGRIIKTDTITNVKEPYSGVHKTPFPSSWDEDVQLEITSSRAEPVKVLSLNAEVQ